MISACNFKAPHRARCFVQQTEGKGSKVFGFDNKKKARNPEKVSCFRFQVIRFTYELRISIMVAADLATGEPGPKIAATPALYKKS